MRRPDWETALYEFIANANDKPHVYGEWDCMLFVANAAKAQTGKDPARGHRRKYKTKVESARYLKTLGFRNAEAMLSSKFEKKPIGFAQRGDIVLVEDDEGQHIPGICIGDVALIVTEQGLARVPRMRWLKAWAV